MSYEYNGFISFGHKVDRVTADSIKIGLQKFSKPLLKFESLHIFRDETDLRVGESLYDSIVDNLYESEFLILLASPYSANSFWVKKEVKCWLQKPDIYLGEIPNWQAFIDKLVDGSTQTKIIWSFLDTRSRKIIDNFISVKVFDEKSKKVLLSDLNDVIKDKKLSKQLIHNVKDVVNSGKNSTVNNVELLNNKEIRNLNRSLLEAIFDGKILTKSERKPQNIIILLTEGDIAWDNNEEDFDWEKTTALAREIFEGLYDEIPLYLDFRDIKIDYLGIEKSDIQNWLSLLKNISDSSSIVNSHLNYFFTTENREMLNKIKNQNKIDNASKKIILKKINEFINFRFDIERLLQSNELNTIDLFKFLILTCNIDKNDEDSFILKSIEEQRTYLTYKIDRLSNIERMNYNRHLLSFLTSGNIAKQPTNKAKLTIESVPFRNCIARIAAPLHGLSLGKMIGEAVKIEKMTKKITLAVAVFFFLTSILILLLYRRSNTLAEISYLKSQTATADKLSSQSLNMLDSNYTSSLENILLTRNMISNVKSGLKELNNHPVKFEQEMIKKSGLEELIYDLEMTGELNLLECLQHNPNIEVILKRHSAPVFGVSFSFDGKLLVSCDRAGNVILWDLVSFEEIKRIKTAGVSQVAFTPHNKIVLFTQGNDVFYWNYSSSDKEGPKRYNFFKSNVSWLCIDPKGEVYSLTGKNVWKDKIDLSNIKSNKAVEVNDSIEPYSSLFWKSSAINEEKSSRLAPLNKSKELYKFAVSNIRDMVWSRTLNLDATQIATSNYIGDIDILDLKSGESWQLKLQQKENQKKRIYSLAFGIDGNTLASGNKGGEIVIWQFEKDWQAKKIFRGTQKIVTGISLNKNINLLASGGQDNSIIIWNVNKSRFLRGIITYDKALKKASPLRNSFATLSQDGKIEMWSYNTSQKALFKLPQIYKDIESNEDNDLLLSSGLRQITIWKINNKSVHKINDIEMKNVKDYWCMGLGNNGKKISAFYDSDNDIRKVCLWKSGGVNVDLINEINFLENETEHMSNVPLPIFGPDCKTLIWKNSLFKVRARNLITNSMIPNLDPVYFQENLTHESYCVNKTGEILAIGCSEGKILLLNLTNGNQIKNSPLINMLDDSPITKIAFLYEPDILAACQNGKTYLWDYKSGNQVCKPFDGNFLLYNSHQRTLVTMQTNIDKNNKICIWEFDDKVWESMAVNVLNK